jgi:hypothetical protein
MSILNRRNAVMGWLAWLGAKTLLKQKARQAVPGRVGGSWRPNKGAIAAGVAAVVGVLVFWRKSSGGDAPEAEPQPEREES